MPTGALERLTEVIARGMGPAEGRDTATEEVRKAIEGLFGERYHKQSLRSVRVALMPAEDNVSFAGFVHPDSPPTGVYGGMSMVWFPLAGDGDEPPASLLAFVCGTRGLAPDESVMGRPGHARHLQALRRYLGAQHEVAVWTKHDPANLSQPLPEGVRTQYPRFASVFTRYGNFLYALAQVPEDPLKARAAVAAFVDYYAWERGWRPLRAAEEEVSKYKNDLRASLFPRITREHVHALVRERRFIILQGPPGTGKTRLAGELLREEFVGRGSTVQFHPAVTYETFVAGISPAVTEQHLRFRVTSGWLVEAAREAANGDWLLVIDEINRADLGRVLGEAIYLFEAREIKRGEARTVRLPQPLKDGTEELTIPPSLFVLGTMNSADRSIAILDLAVRRRFAFVDVWPDVEVVARQGVAWAEGAFGRLQDVFTQYAPADALVLLPGHAYFLADSESELARRLRFDLVPLLQEYLREGRLGACESELRAYLDWLEGELARRE
jgi:5-methylcytosine-specific restriction protein B